MIPQPLNPNEYDEACDKILVEAIVHGLVFEVIKSAFKHKEEFPDSPLLQCLQVGAHEWDV